ncbi:MAG TPA: beta-(1-3)-glucosyl transferase [Gammaproteobacteria bacterium]|nr:beta-(1-3)-glucosyl transferase [Gammaproteobacteria bacterium]
MSRSSIVYPVLLGILSFLLWALLNQPNELPAWPDTIQGFSFNPMQRHHNPQRGDEPTLTEIDQDLALIEGRSHSVRTYTVEGNLAHIPELARARDLNVALGAWIGNDTVANKAELERMLTTYRENETNVVRVLVGNEAILRSDVRVSQLIEYLDYVQSHLEIPVSTAEPWHIWLKFPQLVENVDFIAVHLLPYWENLDVDYAIKFIRAKMDELATAYPDKPIVITEVGWPSRGPTRGGAKASIANQASFLRNFLAMAEEEDYTYYVIEAFDQPWKTSIEGAAGDAWGVWDANRKQKFPLADPVENVPHWRTLASICVGLAIIFIAFLFRDSRGLNHRGRGFLTLLAFAIATAIVWIFYTFTQRYLDASTVVTAIILSLSVLGIAAVVLAEAHEWAEAQWRKEYRRTPMRMKPSDYKPRVSIHVPAHNEPPDMLIKTLDALSRLDYPDYEVLVIDNNTDDPDIWKPVRAHCETLGERFRFFHVNPIDGFKAGALNFALRQTDPTAEIVAVIDSDYLVDPQWLSEMVPGFENPNMAIVQAPQDYHDGAESLFKAMINAEYQGFFHIGMVTRNERNAIIQHGTMTMVRHSVLKEVDGWPEWCITEDSELGLRIFSLGYEATYIPRSYGQGVMPDTFLNYKKQRFRWAYGAVLIMRHHLSSLLGMNKTRLTSAQRYHFLAGWLPWLADGINLFFNLAALVWSTLLIMFPEKFAAPEMMFSILPLVFFVFKLSKMFFLYRGRIRTNFRQIAASALAGLALSHTIGRAVVSGMVNDKVGFFRTPKMTGNNRLLKALAESREELLFAIAFLLAVIAMTVGINNGDLTNNASVLDVQMWRLVIAVQSIPFLASVAVSIISALPQLPANIIGTMRPINREADDCFTAPEK